MIPKFTKTAAAVCAVLLTAGCTLSAASRTASRFPLPCAAQTANAADILFSRECGQENENAVFTLDSAGTLTVSGTGKIADSYFNAHFYHDFDMPVKSIRKVIIGEGITDLGDNNFWYYENLTEVVLPSTMTRIGTNSLYDCPNLSKITVPESLTFFGRYALRGTPWWDARQKAGEMFIVNDVVLDGSTCTGEVRIPAGIKAVAGDAFEKNENITAVVIPESVTDIQDYAFWECSALENISIPESVTHFGEKAFEETKWLDARRKADPLVVVNNMVIDGKTCKGTVTVPDGITGFGDMAFNQAAKLTRVIIPDSMTEISFGAFMDCTALTSVGGGKNITAIADMAFMGCESLKKMNVPKKVKSIGEAAFCRCISLEEVSLPAGISCIAPGTFSMCTKLGAVTLPDGVTALGAEAFRDCSALTEITIPGTVSYIGADAFSNTLWLENRIAEDPLVRVNDIIVNGWCCTGEVVIPADAERIVLAAFAQSSLRSITILNPACIIGESAQYNSMTLPQDAVIYGDADSTAQAYAERYGRTFVPVKKTSPRTGDLSCDGEVTVGDAVLLARLIGNDSTLTLTAEGKQAADINGNGQFDEDDLVLLLKRIVGMEV